MAGPNPYTRAFAQSPAQSVAASGETTFGVGFPAVFPLVAIPSQNGIRIAIADIDVFCTEASLAANNKLSVLGGDLTAFLTNAAGFPFGAAAVLAAFDNTRQLAANAGGTQEGVIAFMPREIYLPAGIVGTGPTQFLTFIGTVDVMNSDAGAAHSYSVAIDVLFRFEQE